MTTNITGKEQRKYIKIRAEDNEIVNNNKKVKRRKPANC